MISKDNFIDYINNFHKKKLYIVIPVILLIVSLYIKFTDNLIIFPNKKDVYSIAAYSDSTNDTGKSYVKRFLVTDSAIYIDFVLQKGIEYPYAGFSIQFSKKESNFLDISNYDYLLMDIEPIKAKNITVYFTSYVKGFTKYNKDLTRRVHLRDFELSTKKRIHKYKLDEFITPSWWFHTNNVSENEIGKPDFSKIMNIAIENAPYEPVNNEYSFVVRKIAFVKDTSLSYLIIIVIFAIYVLLYLLLLKLANDSETTVVIPYELLDVKNYEDEDTEKIVEYIAKHYDDPDLSIVTVSRETGLQQQKINTILKKKFNLSFRQYLNAIKIAEAKRLLKETDRQITDIAYRVGYKNVSHFNRIFKAQENISPKEYRKQVQNLTDDSEDID